MYVTFLRALGKYAGDKSIRTKIAKETGFSVPVLRFLFGCEINFILQEIRDGRTNPACASEERLASETRPTVPGPGTGDQVGTGSGGDAADVL